MGVDILEKHGACLSKGAEVERECLKHFQKLGWMRARDWMQMWKKWETKVGARLLACAQIVS